MDPRSGPALALSCSIAAHALVIGLWHAQTTREQRKPPAASAPRAMVVRLHATTAATLDAPASMTTAPLSRSEPKPARAPRPARKPVVAPVKTVSAAPVETPVLPAAEPAPPAAVPAATAFAGLFAPLVTRPLGRAGWGRTTTEAQHHEAPSLPSPPEQAFAALRMTLLERLDSLGRGIAADRQALHCEIAVDGRRRLAEIRCADPADRAAPWSALQELLAAGPVAQDKADLCFTLRPAEATSVACVTAGP